MTATTAKKPKTRHSAVATSDARDDDERELGEVLRDACLRRLLLALPSSPGVWGKWRGTAVPDAVLQDYLQDIWAKKAVLESPPCCASSGMGPALVWFGSAAGLGTPSLSGDELLDAVRRVMDLLPDPGEAETAPSDFPTLKRNGKSRSKDPGVATPATPGETKGPKPATKATATSKAAKTPPAHEMMAGVEVIEERDVEFSVIRRSAENPRLAFDEQLIAELAPNIVTICRLNPLTIREGSHELIDGETRHRAGQVAGAKALRCKIVRCTDAQAAAIRLQTSLQRRDLNPIERARAMKALQEAHGLTQAQVAELASLKGQAAVSNYTRLLELPEDWQQRVAAKEISQNDARELIPWKDEPAVLATMAAELDEQAKDPDPFWSFSDRLLDVIQDEGRFVNTRLKLTDEQRKLLRIHNVKRYSGDKVGVDYAFNVELYDQLEAAEEAKQRAKAEKKLDKAGTPVKPGQDPKKAAENAKKQAEMLAKRLFRFRVSWYQQMVLEALEEAHASTLVGLVLFLATSEGHGERLGTLSKLTGTKPKTDWYSRDRKPLLETLVTTGTDGVFGFAKQLLKDQIGGSFEGWRTVIHPTEIEQLGELLGINIKRDWSTSFDDGAPCEKLWDDFTGLWSKDQLLGLLKEWKIHHGLNDSAKRADLAALLTAAKGCPDAILKAKAVNL